MLGELGPHARRVQQKANVEGRRRFDVDGGIRMSGTRVLRVTLQVSLIAVLTLFLFTEGGVRVEPLHVLAIPAYALSAICLFFLNDKSGPFAPVAISLTLALVLSGWGLFQAGLMPGIGPAHPVWASASDILGPLAGTPSIAPADTVLAKIGRAHV